MATQLNYGREVTTPFSFAEAVDRTKAALKVEGFGVLCEIDVAKTLKEKIGAEIPPYLILGACNPQFAHRALEVEPELGLLLPCNVVVSETAKGVRVAAIDASAMLGIVKKHELDVVADEVNERLGRVLTALSS